MMAGGSKSMIDGVLALTTVLRASLSASSRSLQYNIEGIGDLFDESEDAEGETATAAEVYSGLGLLGFPLPPGPIPNSTDNREVRHEVVCMRSTDGLIPIAHRDIRLQMPGGGPGEGTIALVGYGGGFHSLDPVDEGAGGTIHVIYCPYDFDSEGVAQKAHSIILDPTSGNASITIAHAEGMAITMFDAGKKELTLKNAAGDATFRLDDDGITMTAVTIVLSGGVIVGDPLTAIPLLPGTASQGSSVFFLSS